jgi:hypothetical protein
MSNVMNLTIRNLQLGDRSQWMEIISCHQIREKVLSGILRPWSLFSRKESDLSVSMATTEFAEE